MPNNTPPSPDAPDRAATLGAGLLLAFLALAMYRPWVARPFDIRDFSEFLPLLQGHAGVVGRSWALIHYYAAEHGRLNLASYVALALKWTLLGPSPVLWQWARAAEMGLIVGGTVVFLRRMALGPIAAFGGASIFILARTASEGWTRMTMGEPLGLLFALGALILATRWRTAERPVRVAATAGALMLLAVLAKEMLIGVLPLVWLVGGGRREDGLLGAPQWDAPTREFFFWSGVPALGGFAACGLLALGGGSEGFTAMYGHSQGRVAEFIDLFFRPWLIQGVAIGPAALALPGNALLVLIIVAGAYLASRAQASRTALLWTALGAVGLGFAYAVLYAPWPYSSLYYAMPFLLGVVLLLGVALQALVDAGPAWRRAALIGWVALIMGMAPATAQSASFAIALQQVNGDVAAALARFPGADRIVVARPSVAPQAWMGTGPTLRRYALATGAVGALPPAQDLVCPAVGALLDRGLHRTVVVTYLPGCGAIDHSTLTLTRTYRFAWTSWDGGGLGTDSVRADIVATSEAMTPPGSIIR